MTRVLPWGSTTSQGLAFEGLDGLRHWFVIVSATIDYAGKVWKPPHLFVLRCISSTHWLSRLGDVGCLGPAGMIIRTGYSHSFPWAFIYIVEMKRAEVLIEIPRTGCESVLSFWRHDRGCLGTVWVWVLRR